MTETKISKNERGVDIWDWEFLGRTTLGGVADVITVSFTARKYLHVIIFTMDTGGTTRQLVTFNNDSAANYAINTIDGVVITPTTGTTSINTLSNIAAPGFTHMDIVNVATIEKLASTYTVGRSTAGAANAPTNKFVVAKWVNTSVQISRIDVTNNGSGDFAAGSEVIVLGRD